MKWWCNYSNDQGNSRANIGGNYNLSLISELFVIKLWWTGVKDDVNSLFGAEHYLYEKKTWWNRDLSPFSLPLSLCCGVTLQQSNRRIISWFLQQISRQRTLGLISLCLTDLQRRDVRVKAALCNFNVRKNLDNYMYLTFCRVKYTPHRFFSPPKKLRSTPLTPVTPSAGVCDS